MPAITLLGAMIVATLLIVATSTNGCDIVDVVLVVKRVVVVRQGC
jgi:hypothetical protein